MSTAENLGLTAVCLPAADNDKKKKEAAACR